MSFGDAIERREHVQNERIGLGARMEAFIDSGRFLEPLRADKNATQALECSEVLGGNHQRAAISSDCSFEIVAPVEEGSNLNVWVSEVWAFAGQFLVELDCFDD